MRVSYIGYRLFIINTTILISNNSFAVVNVILRAIAESGCAGGLYAYIYPPAILLLQWPLLLAFKLAIFHCTLAETDMFQPVSHLHTTPPPATQPPHRLTLRRNTDVTWHISPSL